MARQHQLLCATAVAAALAAQPAAAQFDGPYFGFHAGATHQNVGTADDARFCAVDGVGASCEVTASSASTSATYAFEDLVREEQNPQNGFPTSVSNDPVSSFTATSSATSTESSVSASASSSASTERDTDPAQSTVAAASSSADTTVTPDGASANAETSANTDVTATPPFSGGVTSAFPTTTGPTTATDTSAAGDSSAAFIAGASTNTTAGMLAGGLAEDIPFQERSAGSISGAGGDSSDMSAGAFTAAGYQNAESDDKRGGGRNEVEEGGALSFSTADYVAEEGYGYSESFVAGYDPVLDSTTIGAAFGAFGDLGLADSFDGTAPAIGLHFGYHHQLENGLVLGFGIDGTIGGGGDAVTSEGELGLGETLSVDLAFLGSARARLGYVIDLSNEPGDGYAFMPYISAGASLAKFDIDVERTLGGLSASESFDETVTGLVIGGGVAMKFSDITMITLDLGYHMYDEDVATPVSMNGLTADRTVEIDDVFEARLMFSIQLD